MSVPRVPAGSSIAWLHCEKLIGEQRALCKHCTKDFTYRDGSTSNLLRHVKACHAEKLEPLVRLPVKSVLEMLKYDCIISQSSNEPPDLKQYLLR